jgi:hypothetical protein
VTPRRTLRRTARFVALAGLVVGATACGPKGSASDDEVADSTAVSDSVTIPDSTAPRVDSSTSRVDSTAPKAPAPTSAGAKAPTVGRDSAFGPKFLIDSAGNVTPVGAKKKP